MAQGDREFSLLVQDDGKLNGGAGRGFRQETAVVHVHLEVGALDRRVFRSTRTAMRVIASVTVVEAASSTLLGERDQLSSSLSVIICECFADDDPL